MPGGLRGHPDEQGFSCASAAGAKAAHHRSADRHRHGPGGPRDLDRRIRPRETELSLEPLLHQGREQFVLDSCSSPWAGTNFGGIQIPRIGQEVIVDFENGDPDRPIVTGRVYNADNMPPWSLPDNATQSGLLTRSSEGGSGANANAFALRGQERPGTVWLHAERNQDIEVEHDETHCGGPRPQQERAATRWPRSAWPTCTTWASPRW